MSQRQLSLNSTIQLQEGNLYDELGNVKSRSQFWSNGAGGLQGSSETLTYDPLNRLSTAQITGGGALLTTTYDPAGNILTKTGVGTGAYVYPAQGASAVRPRAVQSI